MPKINQFVGKISERCPLYIDYKKSCTTWRERERELNIRIKDIIIDEKEGRENGTP